MAPKYKLTYFNITGLAEPIRFLFAYGGIEYEDVRLPRDQWPVLKSKMPFGQVPVLEYDGKTINQSLAIARYIAKKVKLAGNTDEEQMEIDAMVENINDIRLNVVKFAFESDEKIKEKLKETVMKETLPNLLGKLEEIAKANNGYFVHSKLSWADLYFVALLDTFQFMIKCDILEKYPNLKKIRDNVTNLPAIKNWIASRPKTDF